MEQPRHPQHHDVENIPKLTDWAHEPEVRELVRDVEQARPIQREHISRIERWRDNMNLTGSAAVKAPKNRSQVQPKLIRKQAEWRYSALSEPFLSSDKIFTVSPTSHNDRDAANQNETLLNWQFETKINFVALIDEMVRTFVDEGTVVLETGWNRETKTKMVDAPIYEYYAAETPDQVAALQEAMELQRLDELKFDELPDDVKESVRYTQETGMPAVAKKTGRTEKVESIEVIHNHPTVEVAEIANLVVDATCGGDYSKAMFMSYSKEVSRADLEKDKRYKNLKYINWGSSILAEPDHTTTSPGEITFEAKARQKVVMHKYFGLYDIDGSGHLVPILACWVGNVLIRMEKNPFPDGSSPFTIIPFMPIKKSFYGEPDGELLEDNQKIVGAVTRGVIDTLARTASGQRGMAKGMLDVTNRRRFERGEDYDFNPNVNPNNNLIEHKFPEIPASAFNMLGMQSQEAESLTGVKTFDDGLNSASMGKVAAGIYGMMQATNRREMAIIRRLSKGLAIVGSKILAMNQQFLSEEEVVRVTEEQFITIRRDNIQGRFDMKVDVSSSGEDETKARQLEFLLQTMAPVADIGITKIVLSEVARLRRMPDLAYRVKHFEPTPDPFAERMKQLQLAEMEAKVQKAQAEAQEALSKAQLNLANAGKSQAEADKKNLDFVEQETGTTHERRKEEIGTQARENQKLELLKGAVANAVNRNAPKS